MRPFLRAFAHNTSVMVAVVIALMGAAAYFGHEGASVRHVQADALAWASAVPDVPAAQEVSVMIGGKSYVLTIRPETAR